MKILICDDDPFSLSKTGGVLQKLGYQTQPAKSGEDAFAILSGPDAPRMAIIDWEMPGVNGLEVCKKVRAQKALAGTYLIMLTAKKQVEHLEEALEAGANDFMSKPFHQVELKARVGAGARILSLIDELKTITGLIPICAWCKKIREEAKSEWVQLEVYLQQNTHATFSHGICPDCRQNLQSKTSGE